MVLTLFIDQLAVLVERQWFSSNDVIGSMLKTVTSLDELPVHTAPHPETGIIKLVDDHVHITAYTHILSPQQVSAPSGDFVFETPEPVAQKTKMFAPLAMEFTPWSDPRLHVLRQPSRTATIEHIPVTGRALAECLKLTNAPQQIADTVKALHYEGHIPNEQIMWWMVLWAVKRSPPAELLGDWQIVKSYAWGLGNWEASDFEDDVNTLRGEAQSSAVTRLV